MDIVAAYGNVFTLYGGLAKNIFVGRNDTNICNQCS